MRSACMKSEGRSRDVRLREAVGLRMWDGTLVKRPDYGFAIWDVGCEGTIGPLITDFRLPMSEESPGQESRGSALFTMNITICEYL